MAVQENESIVGMIETGDCDNETLILYATKHGATHEIAKRIADRMDDATIHDLGQNNTPDISEFDCIVFGSSIYVGMIRKEAKAFFIAE